MVKDSNLHYRTPDEIRCFQEERLRETLAYAAAHSPYYKALFEREGIDPATIRTLDDLRRLPLTTKQDLQLHGEEFVCVPRRQIIDYVTTSGTLGDPVTFALTEGDLQRLAYNEACSFRMAGCSEEDVMQLMTTIDRRFMAGLAYFMGARELGCGVVRVGNGIPELQWDTIRRVGSTACMVVPSFLMKLIDYAERNGIDPNQSTLRRAICIGEALRTPEGKLTTLGEKIAERWPNLELYSTYASTEMQSSFTECSCHNGGHIPSDLIIVELLDEDNNPVEDGREGEVTITTLGVEGMPLLRFKTGDICIRISEPCGCGRHTARLSSVIGRKGQMIKFKGTTLYPPALFSSAFSAISLALFAVAVTRE
ncbi:MAG: AMP-binding protein [Alistipes sp.]|nr:AMP-binding protein [Alistipes sp.]